MDIWGAKKDLDSDRQYKAQIGPLILRFKRRADEIHIAVERLEDQAVESENVCFVPDDQDKEGGLDWQRWIVEDSCHEISVLPVMPDRPAVVRPEVPVKIPKDHEALFFVSVPVWVKIMAEQSKQVVLCQEPSLILSNIWFGDSMSGELCYSLRSRARRLVADAETKPHRAVCPVRIRNSTESLLDVERFCVHVEYLRIYRGTKRLWTNETRISFQGEDAASKIDYVKTAPEYEAVEGVLSEARTPTKKTLLKKSLGTFKLLTGI